MNNNLRALRTSDVDPHIVHQTIGMSLDSIEQMFVVTFDKAGTPTMYATADRAMIPFAALYMQEMFLRFLARDAKRG